MGEVKWQYRSAPKPKWRAGTERYFAFIMERSSIREIMDPMPRSSASERIRLRRRISSFSGISERAPVFTPESGTMPRVSRPKAEAKTAKAFSFSNSGRAWVR